MSSLFPEIEHEVSERAEEIRKQLNYLVHRRRYLRDYLKTMASNESPPENYDEVVLDEYRQELAQTDGEVRDARAKLVAWRHAQKRLEAQKSDSGDEAGK